MQQVLHVVLILNVERRAVIVTLPELSDNQMEAVTNPGYDGQPVFLGGQAFCRKRIFLNFLNHRCKNLRRIVEARDEILMKFGVARGTRKAHHAEGQIGEILQVPSVFPEYVLNRDLRVPIPLLEFGRALGLAPDGGYLVDLTLEFCNCICLGCHLLSPLSCLPQLYATRNHERAKSCLLSLRSLATIAAGPSEPNLPPG